MISLIKNQKKVFKINIKNLYKNKLIYLINQKKIQNKIKMIKFHNS